MNSRGSIVTFYSYKGGVGRSFILASVAAKLAEWGRRVLCLDWDLEAPGLGYYLHPWMPAEHKGIVDLTEELALTASADPPWRDHVVSLDLPGNRSFDLIPAGNPTDYAARVQAISWQTLYEQSRFGQYLETMRDEMARQYDFVLVDSRTGVTDAGGICTVQLPDLLVMVLTATEQSLVGTLDIGTRIASARDRLAFDRTGLPIIPLLSRFDAREERQLSEGWLDRLASQLEPLYRPWLPDAVTPRQVLERTLVPYISYWSFGEGIPVLEETARSPEVVSWSLETIAALVAHGLRGVTNLVNNRDLFVSSARQRGISERPWDFFVTHAAADAEVAGRLAALLKAGGATVFLDSNELLPGDVWPRVLAQAQQSAAVTVVLVSNSTASAYYQLEELADAIQMVREAKSSHRVAPVYLEPFEKIPYGLRIVHGLWALNDAGLKNATRQLLRVLPRANDQRPAKLWSPQVPAVNSFFAGRGDLLSRLAAVQGSDRATVRIQSVLGLGGVGKTTLVAAFCWEQAKVVDIVWWIRAETETTLLSDLADLGEAMGEASTDGEDLALRAKRVCQILERDERTWLLVFDNAVSAELVGRFTPRRGNGRVIVTTRQRDFGQLGQVVDIDVFDPATAEAFLRDRVVASNPGAGSEKAAAEVARRLGGLPLALEQAGAYVAYSPLRSFVGYLKLLDAAGLDPFTAGQPLNYQATASTTWQVSIDAAANRAPLAPKIMNAFGYLAAAPVPLACFVAAELPAHPYLNTTTGEVTAGIEELYAYSLVTIERETLWVHRVVRDAARRRGEPGAYRFVVESLRRVHPRDVFRPNSWQVCAQLLPHVLDVATTANSDDSETAGKVAWLLDLAGLALRHAGAAAQAVPILERAAILNLDCRGGEHPDTLTSRDHLAGAYQDGGRIVEAITLLEANLADRERLLSPDDPATLTSRNNLATAYRAAGHVTEAIALHEGALIDRQRVLGSDHPETLSSRNNLAAAYRAAGRNAEAIRLHEAVLADRERVLGSDHPDTLTSRNNLAETYWATRRNTEATSLHQINLAARERVLGSDHPDTLTSRNNLAAAYWAAGRVNEAITLHQTNLAARQRILGRDHPDTLQSRDNLAAAYRSAGRTADAMKLYT